MRPIILLIFSITVLASCKEQDTINIPIQKKNLYSAYEHPEFRNYWDNGLAEVNSYELLQSRYGETRKGDAVLIFVTEDMDKEKQVKLDDPQGKESTHVLKLNLIKKFNTGVYPYSMMESVFTALNEVRPPLKLSATSQEWCGHTFTQLNFKNNVYSAQLFSYFEKESDQQFPLSDAIPEDGIWNLIRINPSKIPKDSVQLIPSLLYQRLSHQTKWSLPSVISVQENQSLVQDSVMISGLSVVTIQYTSINRKMQIYFKPSFPHQIMGWKEEMQRANGITDITSALLKKSIRMDYWNRNHTEDAPLRDSLLLSY